MFFLRTAFSMFWVSVLMLSSSLPAQESPTETLAGRILDTGGMVAVFNDLTVVRSDLSSMSADLGLGAIVGDLSVYFGVEKDSGLDESAGVIGYGGYGERDMQVIQFGLSDSKAAIKHFSKDKANQPDEGEWFPSNSGKKPVVAMQFMASVGNPSSAMLNRDRLFLADSERDGFDTDAFDEIVLAKPLLGKMDATTQEIINRSGISMLDQLDDGDIEAFDLPDLMKDYSGEVTEAEQRWLSEMAEVASTTHLGVFGLKYDQKAFHLRTHAQFSPEKSLSKLIDFTKSDADWLPDLGFESDNLVMSASFQMEAFRSSAATRVLPQVLLRESGRQREFEFLKGDMLRVMSELTGDSWNDLTAARIGVYQIQDEVNDAEQAGQLSIIGIVDAKDREVVLNELRRLSLLTSPDAKAASAERYEKELMRLIEELGSDEDNIADRAATRLVLAGAKATPLLKTSLSQSTGIQKERLQRVLNRIEKQPEVSPDGKAVIDPGFWTTLNPGLSLVESTGKIAGFTAHTIRITPDASKTETEVAEATKLMQVMFGKQWNEIQVVQVADHFVFMVGSDRGLLKRVVQNVDAKKCQLSKPLLQQKNTPVRGQVQVYFSPFRMNDLSGAASQFGLQVDQQAPQELAWAGLDFDERAASADAIIPVAQIIPFTGF